MLREEDGLNFISDEQLKEKREQLKPPNTLKADKKAEKVFKSWLKLRGIHTEYFDLSYKELDSLLCKFYFEARTIEGERYKSASLANLRYGLNRSLQKNGFDCDIVHNPIFAKSSSAFSDACKELKALGKGDCESYKEIEPAGTCHIFHREYNCYNDAILTCNKLYAMNF